MFVMKFLTHSPNVNAAAVEVREWISNSIPHFPAHMITGPRNSRWTSFCRKRRSHFLYLLYIYSMEICNCLMHSRSSGFVYQHRFIFSRFSFQIKTALARCQSTRYSLYSENVNSSWWPHRESTSARSMDHCNPDVPPKTASIQIAQYMISLVLKSQLPIKLSFLYDDLHLYFCICILTYLLRIQGYAFRCHYNAIQNNIICYRALHWLAQHKYTGRNFKGIDIYVYAYEMSCFYFPEMLGSNYFFGTQVLLGQKSVSLG